jgi:urease accessory protein
MLVARAVPQSPGGDARLRGHDASDEETHVKSPTEKQAMLQLAVIAFIAVTALTLSAVLGASSALAHTGTEHAASFASGFAHPWTGLDHMLAMVAVGLWAGLNGGRALWAWPLAFVGVMVAGGAFGIAGLAVPMVEPGILASVIVLGLLVLMRARMPVTLGVAEGAAASYAAGFAFATAALHGIGLGIAYVSKSERGRFAVRGAGALVAVGGLALAAF